MEPYLHTLKEYYENVENKGFFEAYFISPALSKWDIIICIVTFLFFIYLRLALVGIKDENGFDEKGIVKRISNNCLFNKLNDKYKLNNNNTQLYKWKENLWYALWHIFSFTYNFFLLLCMSGYLNQTDGWVKMCFKEPTGKWFFLVTQDELKQNKTGWPYMYTNSYVYYFYLLQISYWSSCLFYLNLEIKRKDFYMFVIHHVSTIFLLSFSHILNFWRVGLAVLLLHDIVDIFLYLVKFVNYSIFKYKDAVQSLLFVIFASTYFIFRIYIFFFYLVLPLSNIKVIRTYSDGFIKTHLEVPGGIFLILLIWILLIMHLYWFFLILRMSHQFIIKIKNKEEITDIRSENSESEVEEDTDFKKNK